MNKTTKELESILLNTHSANINDVINKEDLLNKSFGDYFRDLLLEKKLTQQYVFINADISEKYGYKIVSGEKHTNQRDVILRLCYAAHFTVEETDRALKLYNMSPLYPRNKRDAVLIVGFNNRVGDILDLNQYLIDNDEQPLRNSGSKD